MCKSIAFCGIDCGECKAFIATEKNDNSMRNEIAKEWSKEFGHEIKPEEINCDGCLNVDGLHIGYCGMCEIRKCAMDKEIENCAYCTDFKCEKLVKFHEQASKAKQKLEDIRNKSKRT
jgi:hypothetical protein